MEAEQFLARVGRLAERHGLSPLAAGILIASHCGAAQDSRTFARVFGVAHALVLREIEMLDTERHLLTVTSENHLMRRSYALTELGREWLEEEDPPAL